MPVDVFTSDFIGGMSASSDVTDVHDLVVLVSAIHRATPMSRLRDSWQIFACRGRTGR